MQTTQNGYLNMYPEHQRSYNQCCRDRSLCVCICQVEDRHDELQTFPLTWKCSSQIDSPPRQRDWSCGGWWAAISLTISLCYTAVIFISDPLSLNSDQYQSEASLSGLFFPTQMKCPKSLLNHGTSVLEITISQNDVDLGRSETPQAGFGQSTLEVIDLLNGIFCTVVDCLVSSLGLYDWDDFANW